MHSCRRRGEEKNMYLIRTAKVFSSTKTLPCITVRKHTFKTEGRGAWLVPSEEHVTLDSRVMSSSPTLGTETTKKNK